MNVKFPKFGLSVCNKSLIGVSLIFAVAALPSCSGRGGRGGNDSTPPAVFHADYDIAMVVRSLADAINVGENLDTADYNFTGVLTDGEGKPLYTTQSGTPGSWRIEVTDSATAVIKNREIGDLMVEDLRTYLISALNLENAREYTGHDFKARRQTIYQIPNGYLTFVVTCDTTTSDSVPRYISIVMKR